MTDSVKMKLEEQNIESQNALLSMNEKLDVLKRKRDKYEADRFTNVDMFMDGNLDKDSYQRRRAELSKAIEEINTEIDSVESELHNLEAATDDELATVYKNMRKYSGENQLSQKMVQTLIDKVLVTDPDHVEIKWKFSDEIYKFIME